MPESSRIANRPLAAGLIMCVTLNAFEALSVVAAMPTISNDLRGDSLYGATFSAYFLANVVAIVVTADQADRNGPAAGCLTGCAIFTAGLVIAGTAPLMWVFVVARALQGFGGGALAATAYVGVARGFPTEQHARLFALLSTAWIVPGVAAPPVTGWIVDEFSWRWIFFGLLPLIPVLIVLTVPALRALAPEHAIAIEPGRLTSALALAIGAGLLVGGLQFEKWWLLVPAAILGLAIGVRPLMELMPPGLLRAAPGLPSVVGARALLSMAFFGTDTFIPFAVRRIHDKSTFIAGLSITSASLTWTTGSIMHARRHKRWRAGPTVAAGLAFLLAGIAATIPIAWASMPFAIAFFSWGIAGYGMGIAFNASNVAAFAQAPPGREGIVSAQLQIADALSFAIASGVGGAILAITNRSGQSHASGLVIQWSLMLAVTFLGLWVANRIEPRKYST